LIAFLAVSIGCGWLAAVTVCEEYEVRGVMAVCVHGDDCSPRPSS
jgi:hypothetical protein